MFLLDLTPEIITTFVLDIFVVFYLVWKILNGQLTPGDFIALFLATSQFTYQLSGLGGQFNIFYKNSLYIDNFNTIFNYKSKIEITTNNKNLEELMILKFDKVSFQYFKQERKVLDEISFQILKKEKIAFVGHNGAGKSTIIKLILHLYNPSSGTIFWNNTPIIDYNTKIYRSHIGNVFQDFKYYSMTIAENILLEEVKQESREKVWEALKAVGLYEKIQRLPFGIDTPLTREFSDEGIMFSGGELQALMLARLFIKKYDLVVLDEPTSALDPYAEYNLYTNLMGNKINETMIIISHRLFTTKNVDKIYYIENGKIEEEGSHEYLMSKNGKYADLYNIQRNYYKTNL